MNHLAILALRRNEGLAHANKSLISRATGSFYTHEAIAAYINDTLVPLLQDSGKAEISVVDPFAGDGRLVRWLIESACRAGIRATWRVALWDSNEAALAEAQQGIDALLVRTGVQITASVNCANSFDLAQQYKGRFDVVITNPPWEALKPDSRELATLGTVDRRCYVDRMRLVDASLAKLYPESQPTRKFAGWGTNLSRVGFQLSVDLLREGGHLGIVLPASTFADQVSLPLRRWVAGRLEIRDAGYFPAEARLFDGVDQASMALVGTRTPATEQRFALRTYEPDSGDYRRADLLLNYESWQQDDFCIPFGIEGNAQGILSSLSMLPAWRDIEGANHGFWAGRELDETGIAAKLTNAGRYHFVKGKMVGRFQFLEQPSKRIAVKNFDVPSTANTFRVAWRDVSRQTQKRRMHATIIPPGYVTGNSLNVAMFEDQDQDASLALLAVMNSLVFEAQVRARSTTSHVSLGNVRSVRMPNVRNMKVAKRLSAAARRCIEAPGNYEAELEVAVAKECGLGREELASLLPTFPKITGVEAETILSCPNW